MDLGSELLKIERELLEETMQHPIVLSKFYPRPFTEQLLRKYSFVWEGEKGYLWWYDKNRGIWRPNGEDFIKFYFRRLTNEFDDSLKKKRIIDEIIADVQGCTLSSEGRLPEPPLHLIPCKNGVYNLKTDSLEQYEEAMYFTSKLPWDYNPDAKSTFLKELIESLVPREDVITLYELMGYCLYRGYPYQKFFVLIGAGSNGKGIFLTIVTRLLGKENVSNISLHDLQYNRFSASSLYNKLANISGEMSYSELSDTRLLKQLTGGDWIEADRKYKKPIKYVNHAKLIFATNQLPKTSDTTPAFFRRAFIIKFPYQFDENPSIDIKIREDSSEMQQEYEWLLFTCINHLKKLFERNFIFVNHQTEEKARKIYERMSNPIVQFIEECCEHTHEHSDFIFKFEFNERFNRWLQERGFNKMSDETIGREMKKMGFKDGQRTSPDSNKRFKAWIGLKWANLFDFDSMDSPDPIIKVEGEVEVVP
jgi:putative DNA primase/helicase